MLVDDDIVNIIVAVIIVTTVAVATVDSVPVAAVVIIEVGSDIDIDAQEPIYRCIGFYNTSCIRSAFGISSVSVSCGRSAFQGRGGLLA